MAMFKEVADIKTADMLDLPVPEAHYHNIAVKPSEMRKKWLLLLQKELKQFVVVALTQAWINAENHKRR